MAINRLHAKHVAIVNAWLDRYENPFSAHRRAGAARTLLRKLHQEHGAPRLHTLVRRVTSPSPRNTTATAQERAILLSAAKPHLRCWILLCSDLAIRSGTAARLGPESYDKEAGVLSFRSKYESTQRLPVTHDLRIMLDTCTGDGPFVSQIRGKRQTAQNLGMQFVSLRRRVGITRKLTLHDLRRTTARTVYSLTGDLRDAQQVLGHRSLSTTAWYLQDSLIPVKLSTLELAKLPTPTEKIQ